MCWDRFIIDKNGFIESELLDIGKKLRLSDNFSGADLHQTYKFQVNLIGLLETHTLSVTTTGFFSFH